MSNNLKIKYEDPYAYLFLNDIWELKYPSEKDESIGLYVDGELVGAGRITFDSDLKVAGLIQGFVKEKHRGNGYQKELIKARVDRAKELGYNKVVVCVRKENAPSSRSIEKCGFNKIEHHPLVTHYGDLFQTYGLEL